MGEAANVLLVNEMMTPSVQQAVTQMGHRCLLAKHREDAKSTLEHQPLDILICEIRDKDEDFAIFDLAHRIQPNCRSIAVISDSLEEYFPDMLARAFPNNFIADNSAVNQDELVATIRKLLSGDIFGMHQYQIRVEKSVALDSSRDKYPMIKQAADFFASHAVATRIIGNIELIMNELITNASFHAPTGISGEPSHRDAERSAEIPFHGDRRPSVAYGIGENHLGIAVSDCFGSLDQETFFSYVNRCFAEKSIHQSNGQGAGMGLFLVYKSLDQMVINVAPGEKTEVIALIDRGTTLGELKKRHHSFHFFKIDDLESTGKNKL